MDVLDTNQALHEQSDVHSMASRSARADDHQWTIREAKNLFALPFADLIHRAQTTHRQHFDANVVQLSTLLSIKI